jgi:hypothetical protein
MLCSCEYVFIYYLFIYTYFCGPGEFLTLYDAGEAIRQYFNLRHSL